MSNRLTNVIRLPLLAVAIASAPSQAQTTKQSPNLGRLMWAAFVCSTYAELSHNQPEQKRLFTVGFDAGRRLLDEWATLPEERQRNIPVGVLLRLGGPSVDFIIGRIFEGAADDAFDKVVKTDGSGRTITDPLKWAGDELKVVNAVNRYQHSNCALLK